MHDNERDVHKPEELLSCLVSVQALCKTSGSTLGYGFPTMDLDEDDGILLNGDGILDLPLAEAVP